MRARLLGVLAELLVKPSHALRPLGHREDRQITLEDNWITSTGKAEEEVVVHRVAVIEPQRADRFERCSSYEGRWAGDEVLAQVERERVATEQEVLVGGDAAADLVAASIDDRAAAGEPLGARVGFRSTGNRGECPGQIPIIGVEPANQIA